VFISHRRAEQADADRLVDRLGGRWRVVTHAVSPAAAETWQQACRRLLGDADAVVCIVGDDTAASPNVEWELKTAIELGRPVIPVRAQGSATPDLPTPLTGPLIEDDDLPARLDEVALERAG
jgi:hypothetical protein